MARPRDASRLASQASPSNGWLMAAPVTPRSTTSSFQTSSTGALARSSRRQSATPAEHHPAAPALVGQDRGGIEVAVVGAAVLDQLERRHAGRNRAGDALAGVRRPGRRQVGAQAQPELELQTEVYEVGQAHGRGRALDRACEDRAARRPVDLNGTPKTTARARRRRQAAACCSGVRMLCAKRTSGRVKASATLPEPLTSARRLACASACPGRGAPGRGAGDSGGDRTSREDRVSSFAPWTGKIAGAPIGGNAASLLQIRFSSLGLLLGP
jgi:hypothetical protein